MYKIVLSGLLITGMLQGAADSHAEQALVRNCRSNYAPFVAKYSNPDVDAATLQHWRALNVAFKRDLKQMALEDMQDARNAELEDLERLVTTKKRINYFEALRLQAQRDEIVRLQAERERLQRLLFDEGQLVPIVAPRPQHHR
jgi:hypothetical protein